jgi:hypothetical protein
MNGNPHQNICIIFLYVLIICFNYLVSPKKKTPIKSKPSSPMTGTPSKETSHQLNLLKRQEMLDSDCDDYELIIN